MKETPQTGKKQRTAGGTVCGSQHSKMDASMKPQDDDDDDDVVPLSLSADGAITNHKQGNNLALLSSLCCIHSFFFLKIRYL